MLRQTPPSSASSAEALGESTATPTENNNSPFVTLTESGSKLESLQTPGGTDVSVSAKLKKPSPPAPPPSRTSRKHPNKLQKFNLIPRPALPIPPPSGPNYKPAISSPLREIGEDGSSDVAEDESPRPLSRAQRQRSLKIRVAVSTTQNRRLSNTPEPETNYWYDDPFANVGPQEPTRQRGSPAATMDTIGQYFSRYPSRRPSINPFGDTISVASEIPYAEPTSITEDPIGLPTPGTFEFGINDPERGFLPSSHRQPNLYPAWDEKEDDDDLHNPDGTDDQPPRLRDYCLHWNPRRCGRIFCGGLVVAGILAVFIVWPIVSGVRVSNGGIITERISPVDYGILGSIRTIMVDPDTPDYAMTRNSVLGRGELKLVFSDEFSQEGRTFYPGEDQFWEAVDLHYAATNDLEWYDPDAITTADGALQIRLDAHRNHDLDYRSGMLQSWNKLCFKGGVMEVSASLAGPGGAPGLWPGIWTLGNLARPGYRASTDGLWPYSYNKCDVGITPNQSSPDGISFLPGQRLAKCTCEGEDHPSPGIGRGAPEIDSLEGSVDYGMRVGVATQSSQIAPFDIWYQPDYDFVAIKNLSITQMNGWRGGPFQQALSSVTTLNNDWYDGIQYQKYAFEYIPGEADGSIAWFVGDEETIRMTGNAIGPNGNIGQRDISQEPMSMILNLGFSTAWAWIDYDVLAPRLMEGTIMRIDYVRIYQEEGKESITCDPPGYPTTTYIRDHPRAYNNPNITIWDGINAANNPALLITVADSSARHGVLMAKEFLHGPVYMNS